MFWLIIVFRQVFKSVVRNVMKTCELNLFSSYDNNDNLKSFYIEFISPSKIDNNIIEWMKAPVLSGIMIHGERLKKGN